MDLLRKLAIEQDAAIIAVTHDEKIFRIDSIISFNCVTESSMANRRPVLRSLRRQRTHKTVGCLCDVK